MLHTHTDTAQTDRHTCVTISGECDTEFKPIAIASGWRVKISRLAESSNEDLCAIIGHWQCPELVRNHLVRF